MRHFLREDFLSETETLTEQLRKAAHILRCNTERLFQLAFEWAFGKGRNSIHEADLAHKRFVKRGTFAERTWKAIKGFLYRELNWNIAKPA